MNNEVEFSTLNRFFEKLRDEFEIVETCNGPRKWNGRNLNFLARNLTIFKLWHVQSEIISFNSFNIISFSSTHQPSINHTEPVTEIAPKMRDARTNFPLKINCTYSPATEFISFASEFGLFESTIVIAFVLCRYVERIVKAVISPCQFHASTLSALSHFLPIWDWKVCYMFPKVETRQNQILVFEIKVETAIL